MLPWQARLYTWAALVFVIYVSGHAKKLDDLLKDDGTEADPRFKKVVKNLRKEVEGQREARRLLSLRTASSDSESDPSRRLTHQTTQRHASLYFWYEPAKGQTTGISAWYNEAVITARDEDSFYAVNGHAYGYSGIQAVNMGCTTSVPCDSSKTDYGMTQGKVLFSIWDQLCVGDVAANCPEDKQVQVEACCNECTCTRFEGEGTGGKCYFYFNDWVIGTKYSFLMTSEEMANDQVRFKGYFYAPEWGTGWRHMVTFVVNRGDKSWDISGQYTFVEMWTAANPEATRWGKFGPVLARRSHSATDPWDIVYQARYYYNAAGGEDTTHINANATLDGGDSSSWEMGIGGTLVHETASDTRFTFTSPLTNCPQALKDYVLNESMGLEPLSPTPLTVAVESTRRLLELDDLVSGVSPRRLNNPEPIAPVDCLGADTAYPSTNMKVVTVTMDLANVDYTGLIADTALTTSFVDAVSAAVAAKAGTDITNTFVASVIVSGSRRLLDSLFDEYLPEYLHNYVKLHGRRLATVNVKSTVTPPATTNYSLIENTLDGVVTDGTLATEVKTQVEAVSGMSAKITGTLAVSGLMVAHEAIIVDFNASTKNFWFLPRPASTSRPSAFPASITLTLLLCCLGWLAGIPM
jgi:hypothetical protein